VAFADSLDEPCQVFGVAQTDGSFRFGFLFVEHLIEQQARGWSMRGGCSRGGRRGRQVAIQVLEYRQSVDTVRVEVLQLGKR
jgi:hypothetical protein